jgi:hypothetical protein
MKSKEKLKPGASSPGAKQYGDRPTGQRTKGPSDEESYRGTMLAPKNGEIWKELD